MKVGALAKLFLRQRGPLTAADQVLTEMPCAIQRGHGSALLKLVEAQRCPRRLDHAAWALEKPYAG